VEYGELCLAFALMLQHRLFEVTLPMCHDAVGLATARSSGMGKILLKQSTPNKGPAEKLIKNMCCNTVNIVVPLCGKLDDLNWP